MGCTAQQSTLYGYKPNLLQYKFYICNIFFCSWLMQFFFPSWYLLFLQWYFYSVGGIIFLQWNYFSFSGTILLHWYFFVFLWGNLWFLQDILGLINYVKSSRASGRFSKKKISGSFTLNLLVAWPIKTLLKWNKIGMSQNNIIL